MYCKLIQSNPPNISVIQPFSTMHLKRGKEPCVSSVLKREETHSQLSSQVHQDSDMTDRCPAAPDTKRTTRHGFSLPTFRRLICHMPQAHLPILWWFSLFTTIKVTVVPIFNVVFSQLKSQYINKIKTNTFSDVFQIDSYIPKDISRGPCYFIWVNHTLCTHLLFL